ARSPLFTTRLVGPKDAVREHWRLGPGQPVGWESRVLLARPDAIEAAMVGLERVYLTIVNAPEEVVIAGDPAACSELARRVGGESIAAPFGQVLHCRPVRSEQGELERV